MSTRDWTLRSRRTVTPEGVRPAAIRIRSGRIVAVDPFGATGVAQAECVDVGDAAVMPGLVDTHIHINEPGRTEWEGFGTATRAAAAGGITTLLDMPLNSVPPTTTVEGLHAKAQAAAGRCRVHVGFWGGAVPGNEEDLEHLAAAGVFGFKCFLADSGVAEFERVGRDGLRTAMEGRTTLIIAHRLSTIQHADRILVIHKGEIHEQGNHDELLAKGGLYARLYDLQYRMPERHGGMENSAA